jgi:hypothetical protein
MRSGEIHPNLPSGKEKKNVVNKKLEKRTKNSNALVEEVTG